MFGSKALERTLTALIAENTDLRRAIADERALWSAEREKLFNMLIAATAQPVRLGISPSTNPSIEVKSKTEMRPRRINFPGYKNTVPLPPYPKMASNSDASEAN